MILLFSYIGSAGVAEAQNITASYIQARIAQDSGRDGSAYAHYSRKLAKTLSQYSPEALDRIFGKQVEINPGPQPQPTSGPSPTLPEESTTLTGTATESGATPADTDGLPDPAPVIPSGTQPETLQEKPVVPTPDHIQPENIQFKYGSAALTDMAKRELDKVVDYMKQNPSRILTLEGHSWYDNPVAMRISIDRAASAKNYLKLEGISASRLDSKGFGATRQIIKVDFWNATPESAVNRRVELKFQ